MNDMDYMPDLLEIIIYVAHYLNYFLPLVQPQSQINNHIQLDFQIDHYSKISHHIDYSLFAALITIITLNTLHIILNTLSDMINNDPQNQTFVQIYFILMKSQFKHNPIDHHKQPQKFITQFDRRVAPRDIFHETVDFWWPSPQKFRVIAEKALVELSEQSGKSLSLKNCFFLNRKIPQKGNFITDIDQFVPSSLQEVQKLLKSSMSKICKKTSVEEPIIIEVVPQTKVMVKINIKYRNRNQYNNQKAYPLNTLVSEIIEEHLQFDYLMENYLQIVGQWKLCVWYTDVFGNSRTLQIDDYHSAKQICKQENKQDLDFMSLYLRRHHIEIHNLVIDMRERLQIFVSLEDHDQMPIYEIGLGLGRQILQEYIKSHRKQCSFENTPKQIQIQREKEELKGISREYHEIQIMKLKQHQFRYFTQQDQNKRISNYCIFNIEKDIVKTNQTIQDILIKNNIPFDLGRQVIISRNKQLFTMKDIRDGLKTITDGESIKEGITCEDNTFISTYSTVKQFCASVRSYIPLRFQICPKYVNVRLFIMSDDGIFEEQEVFGGKVMISQHIDDLIDTHIDIVELCCQNRSLLEIKNIQYRDIYGNISIISGQKRQAIQRRKFILEKMRTYISHMQSLDDQADISTLNSEQCLYTKPFI